MNELFSNYCILPLICFHESPSICFQKFGNLIISSPYIKSYTLKINCNFLAQHDIIMWLSFTFGFLFLCSAPALSCSHSECGFSQRDTFSFYQGFSPAVLSPSNLWTNPLGKFRGRSFSGKFFPVITTTPDPFSGHFLIALSIPCMCLYAWEVFESRNYFYSWIDISHA